MKRKLWSILSVTLLAGSLLTGCGGAKQDSAAPAAPTPSTEPPVAEVKMESELIVAGNGATVETLMKDKIFKLFNEKYPDVKLTYVSGVSTDIVAKVKGQQASPQIDVAIIEGGEQEKGRQEGLWEPLTADMIPNLSRVPSDLAMTENSGVTVNFTPMGISYNSKVVQEKGLPVPTSWNDLARPELKGNITITDVKSNFGRSALIMLSYANGGSEKDMEPGFKQMETIAGYIPTFAKSAAQLQQDLQSETAAYTTWTMARSLTQKAAGLPLEFVFPQEGGNIVPNVGVMIKGAKHPEAAKEFLNMILTDEVQKLYATDLYYNPATDVELPADVAKTLEFDRSKVVNFDYEAIATSMPAWLDRYDKEISVKIGK
ncbi:ABC transporter substrate-binding protein [Ammoniphilus sp. CFH 90114]|uniref:ABC transporter substrate-binding protein n=1 Tax=Ammoniphilus sp. CFH 90114 TaxID=2493665 RepID=UPI00100E2311|nr:ABC transporter substrate-binding protein [Ammoniphilus sp. CFH 90114]RXT08955.1 ABC transporter substrate-binding protein [Ammoniphilus sp. CFH 90114]